MVPGAPPGTDAISQGQEVPHIISGGGPGHSALGIPTRIDPVGIGNNRPVLLGQGIESCAVKHGGSTLRKPVENQHQGQRIRWLGATGHIDLGRSVHTSVAEGKRGRLGFDP